MNFGNFDFEIGWRQVRRDGMKRVYWNLNTVKPVLYDIPQSIEIG
jgi:hypothetical protein